MIKNENGTGRKIIPDSDDLVDFGQNHEGKYFFLPGLYQHEGIFFLPGLYQRKENIFLTLRSVLTSNRELILLAISGYLLTTDYGVDP